MKIDVTIGEIEMTCAKCGAKRKLKVKCPGYYHSFELNETLNKKMVHMCNKANEEYGIMSVTNIVLTDDSDTDNILDNAMFNTIPIRKDKDIPDEV